MLEQKFSAKLAVKNRKKRQKVDNFSCILSSGQFAKRATKDTTIQQKQEKPFKWSVATEKYLKT